MSLSHAQIQQFKIDGYLVLRNAVEQATLNRLRKTVSDHLQDRVPPFELEAQVHYPGAPESELAEGGETIRRLRLAYERDTVFADIAHLPIIATAVQQILASERVYMNPCHHNCIMTKQPNYSSATMWHRDTRYWDFSDKYLINSWLAIGEETLENGAMQILPGSHRWEVAEDALDEAQFLITDHPDNLYRLATARRVELEAGDLLLFSAHCFHAAGPNLSDQSKFALVYTFHGESTKPIHGTHSASQPEVLIR